MAKVVIAIVNWNTGKLLAECLASLLALPEQELIEAVVVFDNASTDQSVECAQAVLDAKPDSRFQLIRSTENIGFAAGNNRAIEAMTNLNDAHILLLNPDTVVKPGAIKNLVATLEQNPTYGVVGPKLLNPDGSVQPSVRAFPSLLVLTAFFLKLTRLLARTHWGRGYWQNQFNYQQEQTVNQIMGAAFLIRNQVWQKIGPLDEGYWVWFEEVDYCKRVQQAGWHVAYVPTAQVVHCGGVSFGQLMGSKRVRPFVRSATRYARLYLPSWQYVLLRGLTPIAWLLAIPAGVVHRFSR